MAPEERELMLQGLKVQSLIERLQAECSHTALGGLEERHSES